MRSGCAVELVRWCREEFLWDVPHSATSLIISTMYHIVAKPKCPVAGSMRLHPLGIDTCRDIDIYTDENMWK